MSVYRHRQTGWTMMLPMLVVVGVLALLVVSIVPHGEWMEAIALISIPLVIILFFFSMSVEVNESKVVVRFGIGLFRRSIPLDTITKCESVRNPWWYGWGIHYTGRGWLYNISGFDAVELTLVGDKTLRIGSDEPDALCAAIRSRIGRSD
ncbi:MAG: hypothetical protein ABR524_05190 [Thermoanaerobaculia bacterium]